MACACSGSYTPLLAPPRRVCRDWSALCVVSCRLVAARLLLLLERASDSTCPPSLRHHPSRQWHYYYLTDEGINYLREYLAVPANVAPQTKTQAPTQPRAGGRGGGA